MKFNWGTGVVVAFGLFMTFILFFVMKVQTNSAYHNELVEKDYYKQEKFVDLNMAKEANLKLLPSPVVIKKVEEGIQVQFPEEFNPTEIIGKVSLYRPSNQKLDSEITISLTNSHLLIPKSSLVGGLWDIMIDFEYQGKGYLKKETIYF
jgi:hypothetical protein